MKNVSIKNRHCRKQQEKQIKSTRNRWMIRIDKKNTDQRKTYLRED